MEKKTQAAIPILILFCLIGFWLFARNDKNLYINCDLSPAEDFIGREKEINIIAKSLDSNGSVTLVGDSGVGKTRLARAYAEKYKDRYDFIWFIDADLDIGEEFAKLAKEINRAAKRKTVTENKLRAESEVLEYISKRGAWLLLVFDNVPAERNEWIPRAGSPGRNEYIIIRRGGKGGELKNALFVEPLGEEDSKKLAINSLLEKDERRANFLAEKFKGRPDLIVRGGAVINSFGKGAGGYGSYERAIMGSRDEIVKNTEIALEALGPGAKDLAVKIALINNRSFSKNLLKTISGDESRLTADLRRLVKFKFISRSDCDTKNPVFGMRDSVAGSINKISGGGSRAILEDIITKLTAAIPENPIDAYIFRTSKTMPENFEVIFENAEKYGSDEYALISFKTVLLSSYINLLEYDKAEALSARRSVNGDSVYKAEPKDDREKYIYAKYLAALGAYYYKRKYDYPESIEYYTKAKEILSETKGYEDAKASLAYAASIPLIASGKTAEAEAAFDYLEKALASKSIGEKYRCLLYISKAKLHKVRGEFLEALNGVTEFLSDKCLKSEEAKNNLSLSSTYTIRLEILNLLGEYGKALEQAEFLYETHRPYKSLDHQVFGDIGAQVAKARLGLGDRAQAKNLIGKAIKILSRYDEKLLTEPSAKAYSIYGDIAFAGEEFTEATKFYKIADRIYDDIYKDGEKRTRDAIYNKFMIAKSALLNKDTATYEYFYSRLKKLLGQEDPRIIELDGLYGEFYREPG